MSLKKGKGWAKHGDFIIADLILLQISFCLAYWLVGLEGNPYGRYIYRILALILFCSQIAEVLFNFNYTGILRRGYMKEAMSVLNYVFRLVLFAIIILFALKITQSYSRLHIGFTMIIFGALSFAVRSILKKYLRARKTKSLGHTGKSMILITSGNLVDEAMKVLRDNILHIDYFISGIILLDNDFSSVKGEYPSVMGTEDLEEIGKKWVDEVFILQPSDVPVDKDLLNTITEMGITVNYTLDLFNDPDWPLMDYKRIGGYKVMTSSINFMTFSSALMKRGMDILGGLVGSLLTCVMCIFIAPAIYIRDPGPIFFRQKRVGLNGKPFSIYKFRTMYTDAEERKASLMSQNKHKDNYMFKMDDDPRIIGSEKKNKNGKPCGIGNILRDYSLDEFPQFFNVIKGDMSLVGTRPPTIQEFEIYEPKHRARMSIKPGITGMWQVNGRSEITDFEEVVRLDRQYIENWSLWLDIKILFKTIYVIITRKGAK